MGKREAGEAVKYCSDGKGVSYDDHSRTLSERSLNSRSGSSRVREKGTVCLRHKEEAVGKITYMCQKCVEAGKHGVL